MLVRRLTIQNVRSFLDRREILFDGQISILIGPNGGGKTNLLDTLVTMLRRYLFNAPFYRHSPTPEQPDRWEEVYNDHLNQLFFERHSGAVGQPQLVELEIEVTEDDLVNMRAIQADHQQVLARLNRRFITNPWQGVADWNVDAIQPKTRIIATWTNDHLLQPDDIVARQFLQYLHVFETDNIYRSMLGMGSLRMPMAYLPVNRAAGGFNSNVSLAGYNDYDQKRSSDAASSRTGTNIIPLAIGRLAQKFRLLQENSNVAARETFIADTNLMELSRDLKELGYSWELVTVDPLSNTYDIKLTKQGSSFLVSAASSGERELLTYLFAIYALNVRNALIVVDEPELHLHPRWQIKLLALFEKLSKTTGNQFVLATHSPTFISPASIQYVSRVFSENQKSDIVRLNSTELPNAKHLFNVVNSQNNERVFFADKVLLVEGLTDRIVIEKILEIVAASNETHGLPSLEVVSVGGKNLFPAYQKLLDACHVAWVVMADLDYIEQVGDNSVKALFAVDSGEIKKDVIDNVGSMDGASLVTRIDEAIKSGNWEDAQGTWEYIKSRRRRLVPDLSAAQSKTLDDFISKKEAENLFILRRGALEDYLPDGHRNKDVGKLIALVSDPDFLAKLPGKSRNDLERIAKAALGLAFTSNEAQTQTVTQAIKQHYRKAYLNRTRYAEQSKSDTLD